MNRKRTEDRPYMGLGVFQPEGDAAPGTTIVGGQPEGRRRRGTVAVPVGLEQLLFTAATDPAFRAELVRDREAAAARRGLALTDSERWALTVAPGAQLEAMIDRIDTSEQNLKRHRFMRAVAAAAVTLAAGTGLGACGAPDGGQAAGETGAPFQGPVDARPVEIEAPEPMPPTGIRPEEVPEPVQPMAGLMAAPPDASVELAPPPPKRPPKKPVVDVEPPQAPTRGHSGNL